MLNKFLLASGGKRTIDLTTPKEIVQSGYTTSASARPQVLSNGWIVSAVFEPVSYAFYFYKSKDNGMTWSRLCYTGTGTGINTPFSLTSYGTMVYLLYGLPTGSYVRVFAFNAATQTDTQLSGWGTDVDTAQTYVNACSIAVNPSNGHLTAAWSSKNATYPNSFNIRSAKSIDGGVTWTMQDGTAGVDQITTDNTVNIGHIGPAVIYKQDSKPAIVCSYTGGTADTRYIRILNYTTVWSNITIYSGTPCTQSSPSATVQRYGANVGRIEIVWMGMDATYTSAYNIRVSYSDDNGVTWSAMQRLTNQSTYDQRYPSITANNKGEVFIMYQGADATYPMYNIRQLKKTAGSWGATPTNITINTNTQLPSTCDNYYDFDQPITIWQDNQDYGDKSLLHFNGTNGSTTFTDASVKVWTAYGNAQISTAQSKFGGASAYFDGSGDYISTPDNTDFTLGTENFTVDCWVKRNANSLGHYICGQSDNSSSAISASFNMWINSGNFLQVGLYSGSTATSLTSGATSTYLYKDIWHHIALVRNGSNVYLFVNGALVDSKTYASTLNDSSNIFSIGACGLYTAETFNGYIDEFRFTKGVARWTSNFTPPTSESIYSNNPPSVDVYGKYSI